MLILVCLVLACLPSFPFLALLQPVLYYGNEIGERGVDSCKTAFLNCVLSAFGQQEALNGDGGPEEERSQGISTPCSLLHVASPTEVAPFHQL